MKTTDATNLARQIKDHIEQILWESPELDPGDNFPFNLIEAWIVEAIEAPLIPKVKEDGK